MKNESSPQSPDCHNPWFRILKQLGSYLVGADVFARYLEKERVLRPENESLRPQLPTEVGFDNAIKIYRARAALMLEYPLTIFARITGVDALRKKITSTFRGKNSQ